MTRDEFLSEAGRLINHDRNKDYGDAQRNFTDIADIWSVILNRPVTAKEVALCMIGVKMARLAKSPDHDDSWIDICGYSALGGELV